MIVELDYGRGKLSVTLPDDCEITVIRKRPQPVLADPLACVVDALDNFAAGGLKALATGRATACIAICDITRPVPNGLFLRPMIERLQQAGIAPEQITVLVATGLHRPNLGDELAQLVGDPWVLESVSVINHDARADEDHVDFGETSNGVPVKLDRRFVEADLKIVTGLVEPHFMAGFSGGRKVVAPGVAHEDTIRTFHNARFMEHPLAASCTLDGNPLHEAQLEIIRRIGEVYALNTVLDEDRQLTFVNFGEVIESHLQAVAFVEDACSVPVDRRFKTVVTSAAGYPLDLTYYQTVKGMVTPIDILDHDADLIIASDCSEGIGSDEFRAAQMRLVAQGPDAFLNGILDKPRAEVDEWQTEMQLKPMRRARISLFSEGLAPLDHDVTGVDVVASVEAAVASSLARTGERAIAVIPEGPYVVPRYALA